MSTTVYDSAQLRRPLITELRNFWAYRGLIRLLVGRDLTVRYKRTVLGVWWTFLNPLLTTAIMWIVFGQLFGARFATDDSYVVYLLSGVLLITFFGQGLLASGAAINGASSILTKVYVPAEVFSLSTATAALVNFGISLIPLLIVQMISGVGIPWTVVLVPIPAIAMLGFVTGLGMLVASVAVYFYDVLDLTRVGVQLATYLTPVFYPISIIPERFLPLVYLNPLVSHLEVFRGFVYRGEFAPWWNFAVMGATSFGFLVLGVWVFSRGWKNLVSRL